MLAPRVTELAPSKTLPRLAAYRQQVQAALQQPVPILALTDNLDAKQQLAQDIAIHDPSFQEDLHDSSTARVRNEIFGVYPLRESDIISARWPVARRNVTGWRCTITPGISPLLPRST